MRKTLSEVQALRAVAVMSVVLYHIQPGWLPGGFVGVDVFFVISGFLITRHLLKEVAKNGHVSLPNFWANRVRRILPASLVVITLTALAGWFLIPLDEVSRTSSQGLASTWYFQNWALAAESVDYLASDNQPSAFQHFWSLSVEEQFYLGWPVLLTIVALVAVWLYRKQEQTPDVRRWLTIAMAVVVVASFGYSVWLVAGGEASAYFDTFGRLWELGAGGVLAGLYRDPVGRPKLRAATSALGFGLIALACLWIDNNTPFPGWAAVLPVAGSAMVIASGRADTPVSLTRLLEWRPIQAIGDWSYSIYLWHFPLVVLTAYAWKTTHLPWWVKTGVLIVTIAISALSYRFIEQPFRTRRWTEMALPRVFGLAIIGLAVATAATVLLGQRVPLTEADWARRADQVREQAASYRVDPKDPKVLPAFPTGVPVMIPNPITARDDRTIEGTTEPPPPPGTQLVCQASVMATSTPTCVAGDPKSPVRVALVGDSHANVMLSPLNAIAVENHWRIETHMHASCQFSAAPRVLEERGKIRCKKANDQVMAQLLAQPPDLVIITGWAQVAWADEKRDPAAGVKGYAAVFSKLRHAGIPVAVIRDIPGPREDILRCLSENYDRPDKCDRPAKEALAQHDEIVQAAHQVPGVAVVNLDRAMCTEKVCPSVINNIMVYRDANHISRTWALALTPLIAAQLPPVPAR